MSQAMRLVMTRVLPEGPLLILAGTGSGKDQQGAFRGLDGGALFGIQFGNELLQGVVRGKSPASSVPFRAIAGTRTGCGVRHSGCRSSTLT
jgi:hypothetical protein